MSVEQSLKRLSLCCVPQGGGMFLCQLTPPQYVESWELSIYWQVKSSAHFTSSSVWLKNLKVNLCCCFLCLYFYFLLVLGMYLVVITKKTKVGDLLGHAVWKASAFDIISYKKTILHLNDDQVGLLLHTFSFVTGHEQINICDLVFEVKVWVCGYIYRLAGQSSGGQPFLWVH